MTKGPEDDAGLAGRVAIVSGGGAAGDGIGNGRAAAILLARAGSKVIVADLDLGLAGRTVDMIEAEGGSAAAVACDVTREADCKRLVEAAVERITRALAPLLFRNHPAHGGWRCRRGRNHKRQPGIPAGRASRVTKFSVTLEIDVTLKGLAKGEDVAKLRPDTEHLRLEATDTVA
jgi:NAD(P)-dependent dehydrogenase (short-subunit alcohol dehydrogenase family)